MTIARQFYVLVCVAPLLAITFAIGLTYQFANLSARATTLLGNLHRTTVISQHLASGNAEQGQLLSAQLERIDPAFPERLRRVSYDIGERCTEYLRLDIGVQERLTVERIKELQAELSLLAMRVYRDLETGADRRAAIDLNRVHRLEGQVRDQFEKLSELQLGTLAAVLQHLDRTAKQGMLAVGGLVVALLLAAAFTAVVVRRRILRPVHDILAASERMRLGDLSARAPAGRPDELDQLRQGFNYMADSLARSYAELERKVEERTAQLQEIQRQLLQAEKLSALGLLVGGVAHELNNPLTGIMGFNQLARMELAGRTEGPDTARLLDQVDAQVERCRRIVGNLLQFARKQEPRMEAFDFNAAVAQMLELRAYELSTRNTTLVRQFDPTVPVVWADRDKIQQVVLNLLNNAADAVADTGRAGTIVVRTRVASQRLVLEFLDDGTGFREPDRVFDPFYTTKEVGKGTGLGLSVCYGVVKEHGGEITAENWEKGARVMVSLPIGELPAAASVVERPVAARPAPAAAVSAARPTALVVDDEEQLLRLQAAFLRRMGIDAHTAASGAEAISHLEQHAVDVVVSDVRMPGVDGRQLYEWVQAHKPALAGHFLFASGDLVGLNLDDFFAQTGALRITKPFRYEAYAEAVRTALGQRSLPS